MRFSKKATENDYGRKGLSVLREVSDFWPRNAVLCYSAHLREAERIGTDVLPKVVPLMSRLVSTVRHVREHTPKIGLGHAFPVNFLELRHQFLLHYLCQFKFLKSHSSDSRKSGQIHLRVDSAEKSNRSRS